MKKLMLLGLFVACMGWTEAQALPVRDALAMIETGASQPNRGAADKVRGRSGEVSRFQIMPDVWRTYTPSRDYENPSVAWAVAERILQDRAKWFREQTGRNPSAMELYLLWNKPGHFQSVGFVASRVKQTYKERAQRFANLRQQT